jgi:predicted dehydrogenase
MGSLVRRFATEAAGARTVEGPTLYDGFRVQLVLAAIARSLEERRWVSVPLQSEIAASVPPVLRN